MKIYSDDNPPVRGTAKKIYKALKAQGWMVKDLHYNPNCWGRGVQNGWGTWACEADGALMHCGWDEENQRVYVKTLQAPYNVHYLNA